MILKNKMNMFKDIELKYNVKLPIIYKNLDIDKYKNFNINGFIQKDEMLSILNEFYNLMGYDIIPIINVNYYDYICFYYIFDRENPIVIYFDYERVLEDKKEGIFILYENINEFFNKIKITGDYKMKKNLGLIIFIIFFILFFIFLIIGSTKSNINIKTNSGTSNSKVMNKSSNIKINSTNFNSRTSVNSPENNENTNEINLNNKKQINYLLIGVICIFSATLITIFLIIYLILKYKKISINLLKHNIIY